MKKSQRIVVIGAGVAGLAAACSLAQEGREVVVLEKNDQPGGRARIWRDSGFTFDMGPSWYWMPDVFEEFFARFGKRSSDYYDLIRLDPSYRVVFGENDFADLPAGYDALKALFESIEPGCGAKLDEFLKQAEYKYQVGMGDYVRRPSLSIWEFADLRMLRESMRIQMFQSMRKHVGAYFKSEKLVRILEFPVLFLGGTAQEIPAMYSLMDYADIRGGTWYPRGGMVKISEAMSSLAESLGVRIHYGAEANAIAVENGRAVAVQTTDGARYVADAIVGAGDYHFIEQNLLSAEWRDHDEAYWQKRVMSPSSLLFYLGVDKRLKNLQHHNLFFDEGLELHAQEIYQTPRWPTKPLFYVCCPSLTDPTVAPEGKENLFLLMPVAPGIEDTEAIREKYYNVIMDRLERLTGQGIRESVVVKRSYAHRDFEEDYHSYKGNAYGLANTLLQTACFKPRLKSRRVDNLYYAGQLTVPGPGVPPSLISGQVAASLILSGK